MADITSAPGRPRSAEADAAILEAALDLLIEGGVEGTNIEQVARRAGVTRATVYRRYADKIQLLIAAIHHGHGMAGDLTGFPESPEFPVVDSVEEMLALWARALGGSDRVRGRRLIRRLMTSLTDYPELAEVYSKVSIEPRNEAIHAVLEQARRRGEFPPDADLEVIRQILAGAVATCILIQPDDSTAHEVEDYLLAVLRETRYRRNL